MKQIINEAKLMELSRSAGVLAPLSREVTVDWWSGIRLRQWWRSVAAAAPATVVRSAPQSDPTVGGALCSEGQHSPSFPSSSMGGRSSVSRREMLRRHAHESTCGPGWSLRGGLGLA